MRLESAIHPTRPTLISGRRILRPMCVLLLPRTVRTGPNSRFTDADAFDILFMLRSGRRIGRGRIASELGIGEGSARNLIDTMSSIDLIRVEQTGVTITKYGSSLVDMLGIRPVDMDTDRYVLGECTFGAVIQGKADLVTDGRAQRNEAIRLGGEGCTTWVMRNNEILMAPDWEVDAVDPVFGMSMRCSTGISEGDALVFAGAETPRAARTVAIGVALGML